MTSKPKRLQSKEWWDLRKSTKLTLLCVLKNVNYKVFVKTPKGEVYYHYLNPEETKELLNSEWIKTHAIFPMEDLYNKNHLMKKLSKGVSCYEA